jgi:hypothetical protein
MAPARLPIEISWTRGRERAFRLSSALSPLELQLARPTPFPDGETANARFALPGAARAMTATVEIQGTRLCVRALAAEDRKQIADYMRERLGLS